MKAKLFQCKDKKMWLLQFNPDADKFSEAEVCNIEYWCNHFSRFHGVALLMDEPYDNLKTFAFYTTAQSRILLVTELICKALSCELEI